jgi:hypothetical protein
LKEFGPEELLLQHQKLFKAIDALEAQSAPDQVAQARGPHTGEGAVGRTTASERSPEARNRALAELKGQERFLREVVQVAKDRIDAMDRALAILVKNNGDNAIDKETAKRVLEKMKKVCTSCTNVCDNRGAMAGKLGTRAFRWLLERAFGNLAAAGTAGWAVAEK